MRMDELIADTGETLKKGIESVAGRLERQEEAIDAKELFYALVEFGELKYLVRTLETRLNVLLTEYMRMNGEKLLEFGNMIAERKVSSSRKNWEHNTLIEAVVNKAIAGASASVVDPNTGEVVDLAYISKPLIDAVVDNITRAAAIRDWRVTALRLMIPGLNPDDFCEVEKAERVSIRRKQ